MCHVSCVVCACDTQRKMSNMAEIRHLIDSTHNHQAKLKLKPKPKQQILCFPTGLEYTHQPIRLHVLRSELHKRSRLQRNPTQTQLPRFEQTTSSRASSLTIVTIRCDDLQRQGYRSLRLQRAGMYRPERRSMSRARRSRRRKRWGQVCVVVGADLLQHG